jgi:hypothetical protein
MIFAGIFDRQTDRRGSVHTVCYAYAKVFENLQMQKVRISVRSQKVSGII